MPALSTPRSVKRMRCAGRAVNLRMASSKGEGVLFADIFAQNAGEGAVGAGVRMLLPEQAFGRGALRVVVDGDPGLLEGEHDVGLVHAEDGDVGECLVFDEDVAERVDGVFVPERGDLREALALQRHELGILHDGDEDGFGAGDLLPLVVPVFACDPGRSSMSLRMRARVAGSLRRSISLASPPSWAQGGMKAEKVLNQAV